MRGNSVRFRKELNMNGESDMDTGRWNGELERKQECTKVKENKNTRNSKWTKNIKEEGSRTEWRRHGMKSMNIQQWVLMHWTIMTPERQNADERNKSTRWRRFRTRDKT